MSYLLEVCCGSIDDAVEAEAGGADRVELNSSIFLGGLTPTLGSLVAAKRRLSIPVITMIRPRGGGFCYSETEIEAMLHDTRLAVENGTDGIVFGILKPDGTVDEAACEKLIRVAGQAEIVFHRALDVVPDPFRALDSLIGLGVKRVLTAGQENSAAEGIELIRELIVHAKGRIEILPGGVTPQTVRNVVSYTGADQVHMASFKAQSDTSTAHRPHVYFGFALYPAEDRFDLTNRDVVRKVKDRLAG